MPSLAWLPDNAPADSFPPVSEAFDEPNGLLCAGGDLSPERLVAAYQRGIFPWFSEDEPILWWAPNPRTLFTADSFHVSRSMQRVLKKHPYRLSINENFPAVIQACAKPRPDSGGTWITDDMQAAYINLHQHGNAHSCEVWEDDELVGGIYGIGVGAAFCAESMFSRRSNTSKLALWTLLQQLQRWEFRLFDCQLWNDHLGSLGAFDLPREVFVEKLTQAVQQTTQQKIWQLDPDLVHNQSHE